jgi:hypothetical protein
VNEKVIHEDVTHSGFIAGGITRLEFEVPKNYFGDCVGFGKVSLRRNDLLGEDGVVIAAKEIGSTIKKLDASILERVRHGFWIGKCYMGQRNIFILQDREGDEGKAGSGKKKNKGRKRRSERGTVTTKAY